MATNERKPAKNWQKNFSQAEQSNVKIEFAHTKIQFTLFSFSSQQKTAIDLVNAIFHNSILFCTFTQI